MDTARKSSYAKNMARNFCIPIDQKLLSFFSKDRCSKHVLTRMYWDEYWKYLWIFIMLKSNKIPVSWSHEREQRGKFARTRRVCGQQRPIDAVCDSRVTGKSGLHLACWPCLLRTVELKQRSLFSPKCWNWTFEIRVTEGTVIKQPSWMAPTSCRGREKETKGSSSLPLPPKILLILQDLDRTFTTCLWHNFIFAGWFLYMSMLEIRASDCECWMRSVSTQQKGRALGSDCLSWKYLQSNYLLFLFLSFSKTDESIQITLKVRILFAAFLFWISELRRAVVFRMVCAVY